VIAVIAVTLVPEITVIFKCHMTGGGSELRNEVAIKEPHPRSKTAGVL